MQPPTPKRFNPLFLLVLFIIPIIFWGIPWALFYVDSLLHPAPPTSETLARAEVEGAYYEVKFWALLGPRPKDMNPEIVSFPGFKWIQMARGGIRELPIGIGNITNLETLIVGGNKIKTIPSEIGFLQNLKVLILNDNQITSLPSEIGNLTNLEVLDLRGNKIQVLPDSISGLTHLKRLHLGGNPISQDSILVIQSLLPNTQINF